MTLISPHFDDIRNLISLGLSNPEIAAKLGISRQAAWRVRKHLGLPEQSPSNPPAAATLEAAFYQRTRDVGGGHLNWNGSRNACGTATFTHHGRDHTAARVAFLIANGREPEGIVKPECGHHGCVAPAHVEDAPGRAKARAAYRAVLGLPPVAERCRNGHDQATHGRLEADGYARCTACADQRRQGAAA